MRAGEVAAGVTLDGHAQIHPPLRGRDSHAVRLAGCVVGAVSWRVEPSLALYGGDGFHPTVAGSYAAALTIFAGISGRSPLDLPAPAAVDPNTAERLQHAALEALEHYADNGPVDAP